MVGPWHVINALAPGKILVTPSWLPHYNRTMLTVLLQIANCAWGYSPLYWPYMTVNHLSTKPTHRDRLMEGLRSLTK
jgi:hypothetical protein